METLDSIGSARKRGRWVQPMGVIAAAIVWFVLGTRWWVPVQDPDLWWLMWAGDHMWSGQFPYANQASYTAPNARWVLHEPLVALVYSSVGVAGVGWIRCLLLAFTGLLVLWLAHARSGWASVLALAPMPVLLYFSLSERAVAWGMLLLALMVALLERRQEPWRFPAAVALTVVWANTHGSYVLGIALIAGWSWRWGIAAGVAALLNPNGVALYGLIGKYGMDEGLRGSMGAYIAEWAPLDPTQPSQGVALLWLIAVVYLMFSQSSWRKRVLTVCCGALMLRAWRFAPAAAIVTLPWVVEELDRRVPMRPLGSPMPILMGMLVVNMASSADIGLRDGFYPEAIRDRLSATERIWHDHLYGGWLMYHGFDVYWDGRNDCYPADVFEGGLAVVSLTPGWYDVLETWQVQQVLTRREPLVDALKANGWRQAFQANDIYLLERD